MSGRNKTTNSKSRSQPQKKARLSEKEQQQGFFDESGSSSGDEHGCYNFTYEDYDSTDDDDDDEQVIPSINITDDTVHTKGKKMCIMSPDFMDGSYLQQRKGRQSKTFFRCLDSTDPENNSSSAVRKRIISSGGGSGALLQHKEEAGEDSNSGDNSDDESNSDSDYLSSMSHDFDQYDYDVEMDHVGVPVDAQPGHGCSHKKDCPKDCPIYHDYRSPGRRHYHVVDQSCISIYKARYGRFVRETGSHRFIRLDSDDDEEEEDAERPGWRHLPQCDKKCAIYHSPESPNAVHYARTRSNNFFKCREGRWIKQLTIDGSTYIRLGPNDEEDYDYERDPLQRISISAPKKKKKKTFSTKKIITSPQKKRTAASSSSEEEIVEKKKAQPVVVATASTVIPDENRDFSTLSAEDLFSYLQYYVKYQDLALMEIVKQLGTLMKAPVPHTPNIIKILATGVSGTGKTSCTVPMTRLFGMQRGGPNEVCYIECALGGFSDASHCNRITGPGPGYIGYGSPALVHQLINGLAYIRQQQKKGRLTLPVIFVLLDEIDKTVGEVYDCLNTLFEKGELIGTQANTTFRLPDDVFLIIYSTANFAEYELDNMPRRNLNGARALIEAAMKKARIADCNIRRMGISIPFFGFSKDEAVQTIMARLEREARNENNALMLTRNHYIAGLNLCCEVGPIEMTSFVEYYVNGAYDRAQGIAKPIELIEGEINSNTFAQNSYVMQCNRDILKRTLATAAKTKARPKLTFHIIHYDVNKVGHSPEALVSLFPDLRKEITRKFNRINIQMCLDNQCPVAYFQFKFGNEMSNINVLSPLVNANDSDCSGGGGGGGGVYRDEDAQRPALTAMTDNKIFSYFTHQNQEHSSGGTTSSDDDESEEESEEEKKHKKHTGKKKATRHYAKKASPMRKK